MSGEKQPEGASPLATDTLADRAVRFGCGAALALLLALGTIFFGIADAVSTGAAVVCVAVVVGVAGVSSVLFGERVILGLIRLIKWFA